MIAKIQKAATEHGTDFFKEFNRQSPGFEDTPDPETVMHITNTIDYGYFVSGQIDLQLDDGAEVTREAIRG